MAVHNLDVALSLQGNAKFDDEYISHYIDKLLSNNVKTPPFIKHLSQMLSLQVQP